jgi:hypothetical protein
LPHWCTGHAGQGAGQKINPDARCCKLDQQKLDQLSSRINGKISGYKHLDIDGYERILSSIRLFDIYGKVVGYHWIKS